MSKLIALGGGIAAFAILLATVLSARQVAPPFQLPFDPACPLGVPFDPASPEVPTHNGARDVRVSDFDGDGDEELVTFNHTPNSMDEITFYENGLLQLQGAQPPSLFTVMPPSQILDASLLVGGNPDPDIFKAIYELQFADVPTWTETE